MTQKEAEYGLYTSFMGAIVYTFLGTSRDLSVGPQSLMSLLTAQYCVRPENWLPIVSESKSDPRLAVLLCLCSGLTILTLGITGMSRVVNFISPSVLVGFMSAAAIIIPLS